MDKVSYLAGTLTALVRQGLLKRGQAPMDSITRMRQSQATGQPMFSPTAMANAGRVADARAAGFPSVGAQVRSNMATAPGPDSARLGASLAANGGAGMKQLDAMRPTLVVPPSATLGGKPVTPTQGNPQWQASTRAPSTAELFRNTGTSKMVGIDDPSRAGDRARMAFNARGGNPAGSTVAQVGGGLGAPANKPITGSASAPLTRPANAPLAGTGNAAAAPIAAPKPPAAPAAPQVAAAPKPAAAPANAASKPATQPAAPAAAPTVAKPTNVGTPPASTAATPPAAPAGRLSPASFSTAVTAAPGGNAPSSSFPVPGELGGTTKAKAIKAAAYTAGVLRGLQAAGLDLATAVKVAQAAGLDPDSGLDEATRNGALQQFAFYGGRRDLTPEEDAAVAKGKNQWFPDLFSSEGTPAPSLMSSPTRGALAGGLGTLGLGAALGSIGGPRGAAVGATAAAIPALLLAAIIHEKRKSNNEVVEDRMRRTPPGPMPTQRDIMDDTVMQRSRDRAALLRAALLASQRQANHAGQAAIDSSGR